MPSNALGIPLALDGVHLVAAVGQDEIHLAALLVAPVAHRRVREVGLQVLQDQVLPERAEVVLPQRIPAARKAHEARVEGIDLGLLDELVLAAAVEGPHQGDGVGDFQRAARGSPPWVG